MRDYYIYLVWQDPNTRRNFTIGQLTRCVDKYTFSYLPDAEEAKKCGWQYLNAFPADRIYESDIVFPVFSSRLPDRKRRGIESILKKYDLSQYDEFEFLRKSGAQLPIDTYKFIDPIFEDEETIQRDFYVVGIRHYAKCEGTNCEKICVKSGEDLVFVPDPQNEYDKNAIRIANKDGEHLGYVPRYYNAAILKRINKGYSYSCVVIEVNRDSACSECIKVRLNMPRTVKN